MIVSNNNDEYIQESQNKSSSTLNLNWTVMKIVIN